MTQTHRHRTVNFNTHDHVKQFMCDLTGTLSLN